MSTNLSISRFRNQRGSVLVVALLLSALVAIALVSYLNLNLNSTHLARRTFSSYAALNLAEAGAEEAAWSFNRTAGGDTTAWDSWRNDGTAAWRRLPTFSFTENTTGSVQVYVDSFRPLASAQPKVAALASVGAPGEVPVTRLLELTLRRRSYFASGLVAKDSMRFAGTNASVDSWNSDPDGTAATAPVPYGTEVRQDRGSIATMAVVNNAVLVNQAAIFGFVLTGGGDPQVGTNGSIRGFDTPAGVNVDQNRISRDFEADFPIVTAPDGGTSILRVGATLGTAGTATLWRCSEVVLNGNQTLTILGQVTLVLTAGSGAQALSVTGNASIVIPDGSSLTIFVEGDVRIAGNGLANANVQPISCVLFGTNPNNIGQAIHIAGNGALKAAVYAPNAAVTINGNGDVMGSIIAQNITLTGNAAFHYDEALASWGESTPFTISKWRELSPAEFRDRYEERFSGW